MQNGFYDCWEIKLSVYESSGNNEDGSDMFLIATNMDEPDAQVLLTGKPALELVRNVMERLGIIKKEEA